MFKTPISIKNKYIHTIELNTSACYAFFKLATIILLDCVEQLNIHLNSLKNLIYFFPDFVNQFRTNENLLKKKSK